MSWRVDIIGEYRTCRPPRAGGALVTRDAALAERVRLLRQQGLTCGAAERARDGYRHRDMVTMGWKYNMYNLQAAVLLPQLDRLAHSHRLRAERAARYRERLVDIEGVRPPQVVEGVRHAWHIFAVRVDGRDRDAVVAGLQREGVGVTVHYYPPVHLMTYFRNLLGHQPGAFPVAERIAATTISLPIYAALPEAHVDEVAQRLRRVIRSAAPR